VKFEIGGLIKLKKIIQLKEISLYKLLEESNEEHHEIIRSVWDDSGVHYLVFFNGQENVDEKAVVSVGPDLEYASLEDVLLVEVEGMRAVAFVRGRHCPRKAIGDVFSRFLNRSSRRSASRQFAVPNVEAHKLFSRK